MSQQPQDPSQYPNGAPQGPTNHGQKIADIVRDSLQSGDLSRLKNIGPAVQDAVSDSMTAVSDSLSNIKIETRNQNNMPAPPRPSGQPGTGPHYAHPSHTQPGAQRYRPAGQPYDTRQTRTQPSLSAMAGYNKMRMPKGIVRIVLGIVGMVTFALCTIAFGIVAAAAALQAIFAPLAGVCALAFAACTMVTSSGFSTNKLAKNAQKYYALFDKKHVYTLPEMAAQVGRTPKQIKKDIKKMRAKGWLLDLRFDEDETCLMKGDDTYRQYLETQEHTAQQQQANAEKQRRMKDPATATLETFREEGVQTIRKIRSANDTIPGQEISDKLSRLEANCARIFSYVEEHPDKLPDTRKFMDYYMPTTLKLVEKYKEYEEMDYQPANVLEAKKQIEGALDTIDVAYKNLLESFYQPDTLDVSTDIVVLQNMLEQEGLVGRRFDIGKEPTPVAPNTPQAEDDKDIKLTIGS